MEAGTSQSKRSAGVGGLVVAFVAVSIAVRTVVAAVTPYEFHRDEFLYFSMGTHLRLFHMDFPPMIALLSELVRHTIGVSVFTYRLVPGVVATLLLLVALLTARALGAGRTGVFLTGLAMFGGGMLMRTGSLFMPVVLDQLWWTVALYALLRLEQTDDARWWWVMGLAGGLGLLTKFSIAFIGLGILVALLLTPRRKALLGPGPWIALAVALAVGSPSIIGQVNLHFPVLDQMEQLRSGQLDRVTWGEYLGTQPLFMGPAILLAIAGVVAPFASARLRPFRAPALACGATFLLLGVLHGKPYYAGPLFPVLFAAGGAWIDGLAGRRARRALAWGIAVPTAAFMAISVPIGLPVVPPTPLARYAARLGLATVTQTNRGAQLALPQDYADMLGWREKAEAVARVYRALPPDEQERAVLYGRNYGQAGALDLYGRRMGLPPVVSLAGSFYVFGPGERPGDVLIALGVEPDDMESAGCASLETAAHVANPWGVGEERDVPVLLCRGPALTLRELWALRGPAWG